jgi:hypothetical protein
VAGTYKGSVLYQTCHGHYWLLILYENWGVTLLASVDISARAPRITQTEQHFVAGEIPHELDGQMEGH